MTVTNDTDDMELPVVGALALTFYWRDFVEPFATIILKGVITSSNRTCEQVFTLSH
jgi:hypothetical protein